MNELIVRSISGLIGLILILFVTIKGNVVLDFFVLLLSLLGLYEFYSAVENAKFNPIKIMGYLFSISLFLYNANILNLSIEFVLSVFTALMLVILVLRKDTSIQDLSITFFSILYIPFLFNHITYLDGTLFIWLIYIMSWGTDTFAYIFGNLLGKTKLCPKISPNKTVEGSLGGILGSVMLTIIFTKYFNINKMFHLIILAIIASITSQFGDLSASRIKRKTGIKDFGYIMPGHGGVLDRFDSILLTAPIIYYYIKYFYV